MRCTILASFCVCLALTGCRGGDPARTPGADGRASPAAPSARATATASATPNDEKPSPSAGSGRAPSLADLADLTLGDGRVEVGAVVTSTPSFDRYRISYGSGDRVVSGTLTRPHGPGPFPAVVSSHGYLPPETYEVGDGMGAEENAMGAAGYVIIHPDFTGYGDSTPATRLEAALGLAYVEDVLNAVVVLKGLPYVDDDSVALVGRSLGGGLTLDALAGRPGMVRAAVLLSPVSSRYDRVLSVLDRVGAGASGPVEAAYGTPASDPGFYDGMSSRTYFDRVGAPVLVQHGTADPLCAPGESERTVDLLDEAGVDASLTLLPGQGHVYEGLGETQAIQNTLTFLDEHLGG